MGRGIPCVQRHEEAGLQAQPARLHLSLQHVRGSASAHGKRPAGAIDFILRRRGVEEEGSIPWYSDSPVAFSILSFRFICFSSFEDLRTRTKQGGEVQLHHIQCNAQGRLSLNLNRFTLFLGPFFYLVLRFVLLLSSVLRLAARENQLYSPKVCVHANNQNLALSVFSDMKKQVLAHVFLFVFICFILLFV